MTNSMIEAARHAVEAIEADGFGVMAGPAHDPAGMYFKMPDFPPPEDAAGWDSLMHLRHRMKADPEFAGDVTAFVVPNRPWRG